MTGASSKLTARGQPRQRRANGAGKEPLRSFRCPDELWALIQQLAEAEAVSASEFLRALVIAHSARRRKARRQSGKFVETQNDDTRKA